MDFKAKRQIRRVKANCRERNRMHGLNHAMDILRERVPLTIEHTHQKLSKIETLRLARNYINALNRLLNYCEPKTTQSPSMNPLEFAQTLSEGLSQTTTNTIASLMNVPPRVLLLAQRRIRCNSQESDSSSDTTNNQYLQQYLLYSNNNSSMSANNNYSTEESNPTFNQGTDIKADVTQLTKSVAYNCVENLNTRILSQQSKLEPQQPVGYANASLNSLKDCVLKECNNAKYFVGPTAIYSFEQMVTRNVS